MKYGNLENEGDALQGSCLEPPIFILFQRYKLSYKNFHSDGAVTIHIVFLFPFSSSMLVVNFILQIVGLNLLEFSAHSAIFK